MSNKNAARLKALDQARLKLEDLTKRDVVAFTFIFSEEGAEMIGEKDLTKQAMQLFEDNGIIDMAKRIKMTGRILKKKVGTLSYISEDEGVCFHFLLHVILTGDQTEDNKFTDVTLA